MLFSALFVGPLTVLAYLTYSRVVFLLLYPGLALSLLIAGGHGGTKLQNNIAPAAGFLLNFLVYFGLISLVLGLVPRVRQRNFSALTR